MLKADTEIYQGTLAEYCRTGGEQPLLPGTTAGRLHHYRRLVFNVVLDALGSSYPIASDWLGSEWEQLAEEFFASHTCRESQIWRMPHELIDYLNHTGSGWYKRYPVLRDLLEFEWLETEVYMMENAALPEYHTQGDWLYDRLAFHPDFRMAGFRYPVHTTAPAQIDPAQTGAFFVLLFREPDTNNVRFLDLSAVHVHVLEQVMEGARLKEMLPSLAETLGMEVYPLQLHVVEFLSDLYRKGFILGFN